MFWTGQFLGLKHDGPLKHEKFLLPDWCIDLKKFSSLVNSLFNNFSLICLGVHPWNFLTVSFLYQKKKLDWTEHLFCNNRNLAKCQNSRLGGGKIFINIVGEMSSVPASARLMGSGTVPCPRKRSSVAGWGLQNSCCCCSQPWISWKELGDLERGIVDMIRERFFESLKWWCLLMASKMREIIPW